MIYCLISRCDTVLIYRPAQSETAQNRTIVREMWGHPAVLDLSVTNQILTMIKHQMMRHHNIFLSTGKKQSHSGDQTAACGLSHTD